MQRKRRAMLATVAMAMATGLGIVWAADVLRALGVDEAQARATVESAIKSGSVSVWAARTAFKAAAPGERATLVQESAAWAKAYTESPAFSAAWQQARESAKPSPPAAKPSVDEELKSQQAEQRRQVEEMKKSVASMPAEQRQAMDAAVKSMVAQMDQMQADAQMQQLLRQGIEAGRVAEQQEFEEATKRWQESYPADPRGLIERRLQAFLDKCADVDFDAKLVANGSKMRFADDNLERKPPEWKLCFRAGREAVTAARTAATAWLAALKG